MGGRDARCVGRTDAAMPLKRAVIGIGGAGQGRGARLPRYSILLMSLLLAVACEPSPQEGAGMLAPWSSAHDLDDVPREQRAALADGFVTDAEYEASIRAQVRCLREAGVEPLSGPTRRSDGHWAYEVGSSDPEEAVAMADVSTACHDLHTGAVQVAWSTSHGTGLREAVHNCLERAGFVPPVAEADFSRWADVNSDAVGGCVLETARSAGRD